MKRLLTILFFLTLTACNFPALQSTPSVVPSTQCAYVEARKEVSKLSDAFTQKLKAAAIPVETARAEAYGENCIAADGSIVRFAQREIDFYITLNVANLRDETNLGSQLEQILIVIDQLPPDEVGPNPGYIGVTFQSEGRAENLWFMLADAIALQKQGIKGADLYKALLKRP